MEIQRDGITAVFNWDRVRLFDQVMILLCIFPFLRLSYLFYLFYSAFTHHSRLYSLLFSSHLFSSHLSFSLLFSSGSRLFSYRLVSSPRFFSLTFLLCSFILFWYFLVFFILPFPALFCSLLVCVFSSLALYFPLLELAFRPRLLLFPLRSDGSANNLPFELIRPKRDSDGAPKFKKTIVSVPDARSPLILWAVFDARSFAGCVHHSVRAVRSGAGSGGDASCNQG